MKALLFTDGACRGNPGPMACGWVIYDAASSQEVGRGSYFLGMKGTNNQAEYQGVQFGLLAVKAKGYTEVEVLTDSELVVHQLCGEWAVKNPLLVRVFLAVRRLLSTFEWRRVTWIPRESNGEADKLATSALPERDMKYSSDVDRVLEQNSKLTLSSPAAKVG